MVVAWKTACLRGKATGVWLVLFGRRAFMRLRVELELMGRFLRGSDWLRSSGVELFLLRPGRVLDFFWGLNF